MKDKLIVLLFIVSLIVFLLVLYINHMIVLQKEEIIVTLSIGEKPGFDLNTSALTFGRISSGSNSQRNLMIKNNYSFPIKIEFDARGDVERFLVFEKIVYLDVSEEKIIGISTLVPVNEKFEDYSGKMVVVIKKDVDIFK